MSSKEAEIKRILAAFFDTHGIGRGLDRERVKGVMSMWIDAIGDLEIPVVVTAIRRFNAECRDYPTPARLRSFATTGAALGDNQRADVAWGHVLKTIRRVGAYESVDFDDKIINAAVRQIGGWRRVCDVETDKVEWMRKEFIGAYEAIARSGVGDGSHLLGICDSENIRDGYEASVPLGIDVGLPQHVAEKRLERREPSRPAIEGETVGGVSEHFRIEPGAVAGIAGPDERSGGRGTPNRGDRQRVG